MTTSIQPAQQQSIVRRTKLELRMPEGEMPYAEWVELGRHLAQAVNSSAWWIGDWLAFGEHEYGGERYREGVVATGLDYQTLRNYKSVADRFPVSRRRDTLSFAHHEAVVALPTDEQEHWLNLAEHERLSRQQLRDAIQAARLAAGSARDVARMIPVVFRIDEPRKERYEHAAEAQGLDLREWVTWVLDQAADAA